MSKPKSRSRTKPRAVASVRAWFHPQRGGMLTKDKVAPGCLRYRGGSDGDWREIASLDLDELGCVIPGQRLPRGFLWADPARQSYGLGGAQVFYGPLERTCRDCGDMFLLPAAAQRHLYETLGLFVDKLAVRCQPCARRRRALEAKRAAYAAAVAAAAGATTAQPHLDFARAAIALVAAGGRASLDRAIASARHAQRLGAGASAERVERKLRELLAKAAAPTVNRPKLS
jgi:hypothetical protein